MNSVSNNSSCLHSSGVLNARGHNTLMAPGGGGVGGKRLSVSGPGPIVGVPSGKEGRGGALYYMKRVYNCPMYSVREFSLTR